MVRTHIFIAALFGGAAVCLSAACSGPSKCTAGASTSCACSDGRTGAQVCEADGTLGPCTCSSGAGGGTGGGADAGTGGGADGGADGGTGGGGGTCEGGFVSGVATLNGEPDAGGITVTLSPSGVSTSTNPDGTFQFPCVTPGSYSIGFQKQAFVESIPSVLVTPGVNALVLDETYYPLSPIELQRGVRLVSGQKPGPYDSHHVWAADAGLLLTYFGDDGGVALLTTVATGSVRVLEAGGWSGAGSETNFTFSPGSSRVFWNNGVNALKTAAANGGAPSTLGTQARGVPVFSSQGSSVAFVANRPLSQGNVYVTSVSNPTPIQIGAGVWGDWFGFVGDDGVFYLQYDGSTNYGTLWTKPLDGGSAVSYANVYASAPPAFAPDKQRFAFVSDYSSQDGGTLRITTLGGPPITVATAVSHRQPQEAFSPDGTKMLVVGVTANGKSSQALSVVPSTGGSRVLIDELASADFRFTPDGMHVLYLADPTVTTGYMTAKLTPVTGGSPRILGSGVTTNGANERWAAISPDGAVVAWVDTQGNSSNLSGTLRFTPIAGGTISTVASSVPPARLSFSPDSSRLLYFVGAGSGPPYTFNALTLSNQQSTQLGSLVQWEAVRSPDMVKASFLSDWNGSSGTLRVVDLATLQVAVVGTGVGLSGHRPWWSPDSQRIAFLANEVGGVGTLWTCAADGTASQAVMSGVVRAIWVGDRQLAVLRTASGPPYRFQNGLYKVDVP